MIYFKVETNLIKVESNILIDIPRPFTGICGRLIRTTTLRMLSITRLELHVDALADIEAVLISQAKLLQAASPLEELLRIRLEAEAVFLEDREHWMECKTPLSIKVVGAKYSNKNARKIVEHTFKEINLRSTFKLC